MNSFRVECNHQPWQLHYNRICFLLSKVAIEATTIIEYSLKNIIPIHLTLSNNSSVINNNEIYCKFSSFIHYLKEYILAKSGQEKVGKSFSRDESNELFQLLSNQLLIKPQLFAEMENKKVYPPSKYDN